MKIFILAHALRVAGGRVTCINILNALKNIDTINEYFFLIPDQPEYRKLKLDDGRHQARYYTRKLGHLGRWFFDTVTLKQLLDRFQPDLIWGMGNLCFINPPCPQIISIQNPHLFYSRENTGRLLLIDRLWRFFLYRKFRKQLPYVNLVFFQTSTMSNRIKSLWDFNGKTIVASKAVSDFSTLKPTGNVPSVLIPYDKKYKLFYLTRYYPHKGLEMLVEVMERYKNELFDTIAVITIAPDQHPNAARLLKKIRKLGLEDRVINVGPLKQEELPDYYTACNCLVMPTLMESFSGTYLEAMHFGLPILTSDLDFAREVCKDAAVYFDPWSAESITNTILHLKKDTDLRQKLIENGRKRLATDFNRSWEDIAQEIIENLEQLVIEDKARGKRK